MIRIRKIGKFHPEDPIVKSCLSSGLYDAGTGIIVGGKHIANWLIGQVRDDVIKQRSRCASMLERSEWMKR